MTSLMILPNAEKKTLKFTGRIAVGEHVAVYVSGGADWIGEGKALRLRVLFCAKQVAMFPLVTAEDAAGDESGEIVADAWDAGGEGGADAICTLNLNTIPAEKYLKFGGNCLFILDDATNHTLYGMGELEVLPWPQREGADVPYNLDEYPDIVADLQDAWTAYQATVNTRLGNHEATVTAALALKAGADDLATEVAARGSGDAALGARVSAVESTTATHTSQISSLQTDVASKADATATSAALLALDATKADKADLDDFINAADYDSNVKKILLKHDVTTVAEIDATAFIKDGMVSSVAISNGKLVITFNTDAGLEPIEIPLTDIFNPANYYDKTATDTLLSGKADKVAHAVEGNLAALDSNGNLADSGMALRDFAVAKSLAPAFVAGDAYEVGDLCTSFDNDSNHKGTWLYKCILATDGSQFEPPEIDTTHWALATVEDVLAALRTAVANVGTPIAPSQDSADEGKAADAYATGMALSAKAEARSGTQGNIAVYAEYSTLLEDSGYAPSDFASADALNGKANKVANAISGNLAGFDSYGDLTDSGYAPSDFATPADIPSASSTSPSMDGTAAVGVSDDYARADHVHPSDTNKADASALRYAMPAAVALVVENDAATLVCADRAVTNATIASGFSTLNLTFPAEASGYVRDFYLRITVAAGQSAPSISVPQGVTIENAGGAVPEIADGEASAAATTLVWFSETAPGIFTTKSETVKAVV